jgi:glycine/D-amino acid oxidase-like deaminating enzyme
VGVTAAPRPDVVIVGAGIVGAACADFLAREGVAVLVLESRYASAGVTSAGMGHIVVMDDSPAQLALTAQGRRLWAELVGELPSDCEDDPCGTLWIAADDAEMASVRAKAEALSKHGIETRILSERELAAAEPNLRPGLAGALLVPDDRVIYPPAAARRLLDRAKAKGARLREGVEAVAIEARRVRLRDETIEAAAVVNAAGPEAARLTPGLPIRPRKGHLVITDRYPGFCRHQLVELGYLKSAHGSSTPSVAFNVQPRATGQILLGSSREFAGFDDSVNTALLSRMVRRAIDYMPAISRLSAVRVWTGLRPATPDKLPLIGRWAEGRSEGPWIAAGHEGLGITTAPATGQLLAELLRGARPTIDAAPYDPARFQREAA